MAPLAELVEVCERHGAALIVDETHSFGTHGQNGAGLVVAAGLAERVHFRTVGLSKAVASRGGLIVASRRNVEFFRYEALPSIFSTSVMQHEVAGFDAVLDIFETEEWRRDKLHANHAYLKQGLDALGYNVSASNAQIIGLEAGDIRQTTALRDALEKRGIFGAIFFPPATPDKRCIIRFTVNCGLSRSELDRIVEVCGEIRAEVNMAEWRSTKRKFAGGAGTAQVAKKSLQSKPLGRSRIFNGWLHRRKLNDESGADADLRTARDRAAGALDNHPAE
jgi:CAI-1 autoinducer synthase